MSQKLKKILFLLLSMKTQHNSSAAALASTSSPSRGYATDLAPYSALRSSLGERGGSGGRSSVSEQKRKREEENGEREERGSEQKTDRAKEKKTRPRSNRDLERNRPTSPSTPPRRTRHPPPPLPKKTKQTSGVTVTVFGASGFLGRYVCNALVRAGHRLVLPVRCDDLEVQHLRPLGDLGQVVLLPGFDVRSEAAIARATEASTAVFNLIGAREATRNFSLSDVNVAAAERVARVSARSPAGVERFVHFSCVGAGAASPSERLRTKAAGEAAAREAFGAGATVLRLGPCVGIEDSTLNQIAKLAKAMPAVPLVGGGAALWQPVAAADVAAAAAATLRSPTAANKVFELVGPRAYSFKELALLVLDTMREPRATAHVPEGIAKIISRAPLGPLRHPWFSEGAVAEACGADLVAGGVGSPPAGSSASGTLADLGVAATPIEDAIDHLRWLRAGGYDVGTLSENASTGGAGFGAKVA